MENKFWSISHFAQMPLQYLYNRVTKEKTERENIK